MTLLLIILTALPQPMEEKEAFARIYFLYEDAREESSSDRFYRRVLDSLERHIEAYPEGETVHHAHFCTGECHWALGDKVKAAQGWERAIPSKDIRVSSKAHVRLADHLYSQRKYEDALSHFREAGKSIPDRDELNRCRLHEGICLYSLGKTDEAKAVLSKLVAELKSGHIHDTAQRYLDLMEKQGETKKVELTAKEALAKYAEDYMEYRRTSDQERKKELTESIAANLEDWSSLDHPEVLSTLLEILDTPRHPFATYAIRELVQMDRPESTKPLIAALKDRKHTARASILSTLVSYRRFIDDSLVESIFRDRTEPNTALRTAAADYIALRDTRTSVETLFSEIMLPGDPRVKINDALNAGINKALKRLRSPEAAAAIREIVADPDRHIVHRTHAMEALAAMGDPKALDVLAPLLQERSLQIVSLAAEALGRTGNPEAAPPLLDLLRRKPRDTALLVSLLRGLDGLDVPGDEEDLFLSFAKSKDRAIRVLSHSLLRQTMGKKARRQLREALEDKVWQVRWHAIRATGQHPSAEGISDLIDRLPKEEGQLKFQILKYLHRATGHDLGPDPGNWKKWWSKAKDDYDPEKVKVADLALGPALDKSVDPAAGAPTYFTIKVTSRGAIFVIDISGSMVGLIRVPPEGESTGGGEDKKINVAKKELIKVLKAIRKNTFFNIIWFETRYQPLWKQMKPATRENVEDAITKVRGLNVAGATNIYDTLAHALADPNVDTIYFLSDGAPTSGAYTNPDDILREIKILNYTKKVTIHTIFLGGTSSFMQRLAEENNGNYIPVAR